MGKLRLQTVLGAVIGCWSWEFLGARLAVLKFRRGRVTR